MTPNLNRLIIALGLLGSATIVTAQTSSQPTVSAREPESTTESSEKKTIPSTKLLKLEAVEVLGTRIRQADMAGPSPVNTYNRDYIDRSGAMTLADFLNRLPQNYTGIGSGRGSAPNELNPEFGQRNEFSSPSINFILGASDTPPGQTGVSGVSLRGLGSGSTLVLVDGRRAAQSGAGNRGSATQQGFVDLNTIPLGMIDRIEVSTDGASAIYGADAVAGVINIILKKDWTGTEFTYSNRAPLHGGGREREATITSGFTAGPFHGTISLDYYDRQSLKASQRSFSAHQSHTNVIAGYDSVTGAPIVGRDLRLNYDVVPVIQARTGTLNGITYTGGLPTRFATTNPGLTSLPTTLAAFTPSAGSAQGTSVAVGRFNSAEFLDTIPASQRYGVTGNFGYTVNEKVEVYGTVSFTDVRGMFNTQPGVVSASASSGFGAVATVVPAAYNPFGQDILVGYTLYEFGSQYQKTHTRASNLNTGVKGKLGETWIWDLNFGLQHQEIDQINRLFNPAPISALLASADASQRIDPFLDPRVTGNTQAALYERLAIYPLLLSESELQAFEVNSSGHLCDIWGGPLQMALGGSYYLANNSSDATNYSMAVTPVKSVVSRAGATNSRAVYAEFSVPVFGKPNAHPLLQRLEFQIAGRHEETNSFGKTVPKYGVSWVPIQSLLFRASYSEGFRAPSSTEYQVAETFSTTTVTDPRRTPASTSGVLIISGSNNDARVETSKNEYYGVILEPKFLKGLHFEVNYYRTNQRNVLQLLGASTFIANEALFSDRIVRAAPDPVADVPLNQPGRIVSVDTTFVNFGKVYNESIDYGVSYDLPWENLGRWQVAVNATHTLESTRQLAPNTAALVDDGDTYAPPEWKVNASIFWNKGPWGASLFYTYLDGFRSNKAGNTFTSNYGIPGISLVDVSATYRFKHAVYRNYGKGLGLRVGISNVFDTKPPFSDTIFGFNGGLHSSWVLGRTVETAVTIPF